MFRFPTRLAPTARMVSVVGSFNGWNPTVHLMRRADETWTITVYLSPGRAVYLFSVDGAMWNDPEDDGRTPNGWGSEYSVRHCQGSYIAARATSCAGRRISSNARAIRSACARVWYGGVMTCDTAPS